MKRTEEKHATSLIRGWLQASDQELLRDCEVDTYRASGPGGQKRNKTSSAVRLRHGPTGLMVTAAESRSQHENKARALRRLREALALHLRTAVDPAAAPPDFYQQALERDPGLHVNRKHPDYRLIVHYLLDVIEACDGAVGEAGNHLGLSTGQLIRFLKEDPNLWEQANRIRQVHGHSQLR